VSTENSCNSLRIIFSERLSPSRIQYVYDALSELHIAYCCSTLSCEAAWLGVCDTANDFQTLSRDVVRLYGEGNMKITTKYGSYTSLPDCGFWMSAPFIVLESHNKAHAKVCFPSSQIAAYNNCMLTMWQI
jgi:hypothetical protein